MEGSHIDQISFPAMSQKEEMFNQNNAQLQGDPNQNVKFLLAITLKICVSDPMLVKPKCVWEAYIYFDFSAVCLQFSAVCLQFSKINGGLQNAFWLYQQGGRNAYLQSYSHLN